MCPFFYFITLIFPRVKVKSTVVFYYINHLLKPELHYTVTSHRGHVAKPRPVLSGGTFGGMPGVLMTAFSVVGSRWTWEFKGPFSEWIMVLTGQMRAEGASLSPPTLAVFSSADQRKNGEAGRLQRRLHSRLSPSPVLSSCH